MAQQSEGLRVDRTSVAGSLADERRLQALDRSHLHATPGFYRRAWRRFYRNKVALIAMLIMVAIVVFSLSAGLISDATGYTYQKGDLRNQLRGPFYGDHILGTDANGRDVLVRLAYGGRISLLVASLAAVGILFIGCAVGSIAGYFGGFIDSLLMRLVDVLLCLPGLSILILVYTLYRPGYISLAFIIAVFGWAGVARLIRGQVLSLRARDYVDAARVLGATNSRIITKHIVPNVIPIMVVWISLQIPGLILTEAALSFLGFGVQIPTPSWGNMLNGAADFYTRSWTNVFIPGFMIYITVLAINLMGNGLRDALDPRLNE